MTETWLITGGCGFVGLNLIDALRSMGGVHIRVIDNLSTGSRAAFDEIACAPVTHGRAADVRLTVGDMTDPAALAEAADGVDVIVHLAANAGIQRSLADPIADANTNIMGTLACLEAARRAKARRFIFASSAAVGSGRAPSTPYGASKFAGEAYCAVYRASFGLETVALRFANVYGPRSNHKQSVVAAFINQALRGEQPIIHGGGTQKRSFIHADDIARAIIHAAMLPAAPANAVSVAGREFSSIRELADRLDAELSKYGIVAFWRQGPARVDEPPRDSLAMPNPLPDWAPKIALAEGLAGTLAWYVAKDGPRSQG